MIDQKNEKSVESGLVRILFEIKLSEWGSVAVIPFTVDREMTVWAERKR